MLFFFLAGGAELLECSVLKVEAQSVKVWLEMKALEVSALQTSDDTVIWVRLACRETVFIVCMTLLWRSFHFV